jgi:hypothetical protein
MEIVNREQRLKKVHETLFFTESLIGQQISVQISPGRYLEYHINILRVFTIVNHFYYVRVSEFRVYLNLVGNRSFLLFSVNFRFFHNFYCKICIVE